MRGNARGVPIADAAAPTPQRFAGKSLPGF
jgi:hypothetical protein